MTEKSCYNCKYMEIQDPFDLKTGQRGLVTDFNKCKWEYMIYTETEETRKFFNNIYCNNWEMKQ